MGEETQDDEAAENSRAVHDKEEKQEADQVIMGQGEHASAEEGTHGG